MGEIPRENGSSTCSGTNGAAASATSGFDVRDVIIRGGVAFVMEAPAGRAPDMTVSNSRGAIGGKIWGYDHPLNLVYLLQVRRLYAEVLSLLCFWQTRWYWVAQRGCRTPPIDG